VVDCGAGILGHPDGLPPQKNLKKKYISIEGGMKLRKLSILVVN
jgi:hypothetical protein